MLFLLLTKEKCSASLKPFLIIEMKLQKSKGRNWRSHRIMLDWAVDTKSGWWITSTDYLLQHYSVMCGYQSVTWVQLCECVVTEISQYSSSAVLSQSITCQFLSPSHWITSLKIFSHHWGFHEHWGWTQNFNAQRRQLQSPHLIRQKFEYNTNNTQYFTFFVLLMDKEDTFCFKQ